MTETDFTECIWVFGYYAIGRSGVEMMVWFPDGEEGEEACFQILKGFRNLVPGASYKVKGINDAENTTINGTAPAYEGHNVSQSFRVKCEAEISNFKREKAKKQAEAKARKFDLGNMKLDEIKIEIDKAGRGNKRTRLAMINMVSDYLSGIAH